MKKEKISKKQLKDIVENLNTSGNKRLVITICLEDDETPILPASRAEHEKYYKAYHVEQKRKFMAGELKWPTKAWNKEEKDLRAIMLEDHKKIQRDLFQDARAKTISYIRKIAGEKNNYSGLDREDLTSYYKKKHLSA